MNKVTMSLVRAAVVLSLAAAAPVQAADEARNAELQSLRTQVEALSKKLKELEAPASAAAAAPAAAAAKPAAVAPNVSAADAKAAPQAPWAPKVTFAGDVRARSESIDEEGLKVRNRDRVRARAAVTALVTEQVQAGARIMTGGRDPRSGNATFTGENAKKEVALDQAYVQWKLPSGLKVIAGKMEDPIWRPKNSVLISSEISPEGWATSYSNGDGVFGAMSKVWLEERAADDDSSYYSAQLGYRFTTAGKTKVTLAVGYTAFDEVQGRKPFYDGVNPYGNTLLSDGTLANEFKVASAATQVETHIGLQPLVFFADFARNTEAEQYDTAASAGVALGDASVPHNWQVSYSYEIMEKDSLLGQLINAEFGNGNTDARGHLVRFGYGFAKNWSAGVTVMLNDVNVDVGTQHSFKRYQFDLLAKY